MEELTVAMERIMIADPSIAKALKEGWRFTDCQNGRRAARNMGSKIMAASYRYGPKSEEVATAIAEANRVSVMLTSARSSYNRIMRDTPLEVERTQEAAEPSAEWVPVWSKEPFAMYRELQNIPEHWELTKVVLIWNGEDQQTLRVFGDWRGFPPVALEELVGEPDLILLNNREGRWDYSLTRELYDQAVEEA